MRIRKKLLLLLLTISLVPVILAGVLNRSTMYRVSTTMASGTRDYLVGQAKSHLQTLVNWHGRMLERQRKTIQLMVTHQARAVENKLRLRPKATRRLYLASDYDRGDDLPPGMVASKQHMRKDDNGKLSPVQITYDEQVYFLPKGVNAAAVAGDMAALATMPDTYRELYALRPDLLYWQYTALESGVFTSYPGHGGYPETYDPRRRPWYKQAKARGGISALRMSDVSAGTITLSVSMPVFAPDGQFAGATGIDVPINALFADLSLPQAWDKVAVVMLAIVRPSSDAPLERRVMVVRRAAQSTKRADWTQATRPDFLYSEDRDGFEEMLNMCRECAGVQDMPYKGRRSLWAFGQMSEVAVFPVVIVPYDVVVAEADRIEEHMMSGVVRALVITGALSLLVVAAAVIVAFFSSRYITEPVEQLVRAAEKLGAGDFATRVEIKTGDELEELGAVFNAMGPHLEERERMKQSLGLAMEIQQHLLPRGTPALDGLDIAGQVIYCDETGGDYYDFIELVGLGPGKLGVAVGDIAGHGIAAALLMASARAVLRSHADQHGADLKSLFSVLNKHLVHDTDSSRFMTLFYGLIDAEAKTLAWASAGHDPALWRRRADGTIEELASTGIVLGILDDQVFECEGPVALASGDVVVITTDGIAEAHNNRDELFGRGRLRDVLSANADRSAQGIFDAVMSAVNEFAEGHPQDDDITLVVIKVQ